MRSYLPDLTNLEIIQLNQIKSLNTQNHYTRMIYNPLFDASQSHR